jgi:hypothetical protein
MPDRQFVFAPFRPDAVNEQLWQGDEFVPLLLESTRFTTRVSEGL